MVSQASGPVTLGAQRDARVVARLHGHAAVCSGMGGLDAPCRSARGTGERANEGAVLRIAGRASPLFPWQLAGNATSKNVAREPAFQFTGVLHMIGELSGERRARFWCFLFGPPPLPCPQAARPLPFPLIAAVRKIDRTSSGFTLPPYLVNARSRTCAKASTSSFA
jgi:hypothetical protein